MVRAYTSESENPGELSAGLPRIHLDRCGLTGKLRTLKNNENPGELSASLRRIHLDRCGFTGFIKRVSRAYVSASPSPAL